MVIHPTALIGDPPEMRGFEGSGYLPQIHPGARIGAFVTVDAGRERFTVIGARTWLMKHVHVGHDSWIGRDCELAPHVTICGHVQVGDGVKIGANACIRPYVTIGDGARIGMGAVVTKDVPAGETWVGNPARPIDERTDLEIWERWWRDRAAEVPCAS